MVKKGNTVTVKVTIDISSTRIHSIDLHAVIGKKGGCAALMAVPVETKEFTFVANDPGIYIYHCVGNGTLFAIALYDNLDLNFDEESMLEGKSPDYVVYNGRVGSLVDHVLPRFRKGTFGLMTVE